MAEIRPFRGLRYSAEAGSLDRLIAPPYDVLTPSQRTSFAARSLYNIVHLTLPEAKLDDRSKFVKYTRSAAAMAEWRRDGVLLEEQTPVFYRYTQTIQNPHGDPIRRQSLIALLKVEPFSTGTVLPHEETFPKHKEDRLRLLEATRAHLESIFGLYEDPDDSLRTTIVDAPVGAAASADVEGILHTIEPILGETEIQAIQTAFAGRRIWIADGHHRYETALAFREALGERAGPVAEDYIVIALTSMSDPGLLLLPTHRIVPKLRGLTVADAEARLSEEFRLEECHSSSLWSRMQEAHREGKTVFGISFEGSRGVLAFPRDMDALVASLVDTRSQRLKHLDITILQDVILGRLFGVAPTDTVDYSRDASAAIRQTDESGAPSFLNLPPTVDDMKEIASSGERMPQKSTYYYPKIFSGLVLWSLSDF